MQYQITALCGTRAARIQCETLADIVGELTTYGSRIDIVAMLHDLISGLEHVARIDDVWIIVAPLHS